MAIRGMVFGETGHTLNFCRNKTKMKLGAFGGGPPAELVPVFLDRVSVQFSDLAEGQPERLDVPGIGFTRLQERFRKYGLSQGEFTQLSF